MCGRQQTAVKFDGSLSAWGSVRVGVPQGSILGPLLFSIFLNDLSSVVDHAQINMYANETMTLSYIVVVRIYNVFRMIFSLTFTEYRTDCKLTDCNLMFQSLCDNVNRFLAEVSVSVSINGKPLASVTNTRYLGVLNFS